uniref:Homeobox domain-containing protein n=1 Tax=Timema genevievae TaxID=629358 RepID=A0A7R9PNK8_TIMGE|nr:unnamed protein product [Timema genevievae]
MNKHKGIVDNYLKEISTPRKDYTQSGFESKPAHHRRTKPEVYPHLRGGRVDSHLGLRNLNTHDLDSNPDITVIGSPAYCESDALDHAGPIAVGPLINGVLGIITPILPLLPLWSALEQTPQILSHLRESHLTSRPRFTLQVKVWFQNRRTKHKRMQQEEEAKAQQQAAANNKNSHHVNKWKQETQGQQSSTDEGAARQQQQQQQQQPAQQYVRDHHQDMRDADSCSSGSET